MLGSAILEETLDIVPILVSLPEWVDHGGSFLEFVSSQPSFLVNDLSPVKLAQLAKRGQLVFLINGWNEVDASQLEKISRKIRQLVRENSAVGILITSRPHKFNPLHMVASRYELSQISDSQRQTYVEAVIPEKAHGLLEQFEIDSALDSLSRIPLILSELTTLYITSESLPRTKAGVLKAIVKSFEDADEHSAALVSTPISGHANDYLQALAFDMTKVGRSSTREQKARQVIGNVSKRLLNAGQISTIPEHDQVIGALCGHHLLERNLYPEITYRFSHQQFQEIFTADALRQEMMDVLTDGNKHNIEQFQRRFINIPAWSEPLLLLTEHEGSTYRKDEQHNLALHIVDWAVPIDPVFASYLYRYSNQTALPVFNEKLEPLIRSWYSCGSEAHRSCAFAAMVASGSSRFSDIIWEILESPDKDIGASMFYNMELISIDILGDNWEERIKDWSRDRRINFVSIFGHSGGYDSVNLAYNLAMHDSDSAVRRAAIDNLWFMGVKSKLFDVLTQCDDEIFSEIVKRNHLPQQLPKNLTSRRNDTLHKLISAPANIEESISFSMRLLEYGHIEYIKQIKGDLKKIDLSSRDTQQQHRLMTVIKKIQEYDEDWVGKWVTHRILTGDLWLDLWFPLSGSLDKDFVESLLTDLLDSANDDPPAAKAIKLVSSQLDDIQIKHLLNALIEVRYQIEQAPIPIPDKLSQFYNRIRQTAEAVPYTKLVSIIINEFSALEDIECIHELLELFHIKQVLDFEDDNVLEEIEESILTSFRVTLRGFWEIVKQSNDYDGSKRAKLAIALGRFGNDEDIPLIKEIIESDIERRKIAHNLLKEGKSDDPRASRNGWSSWLLGALVKLSGDRSDNYIIELLKHTEYEREACRALVSFVKIPTNKKIMHGGHRLRYKDIFSLREGKHPRFSNDDKRQNYANVIAEHILTITKESKEIDNATYINNRIKELASDLSLFERLEDVSQIIDCLALPSTWDIWTVTETLERLVLSGINLDSVHCKQALDPIIDKLINNTEHYQSNDRQWVLEKCVCILLFTNRPECGVELLNRIFPTILYQHYMYDIVEIAGYTRSEAVASYLVNIWKFGKLEKRLINVIINSLSKLNMQTGNEAILSLIGLNDADAPLIEMSREHIESGAAAIKSIIESDDKLMVRLADVINTSMTRIQLEIVANIVRMIKNPEVDLMSLKLISDKSDTPWPLIERLREIFIVQAPISDMSGAYTLSPRMDTTIRPYLLKMAHDDAERKQRAFELLGQIDLWRLEYGKPDFEPRHPDFTSGLSWPITIN